MEDIREILIDTLEKFWFQLNLLFDLENSTAFLILKPFLENIAEDPLVFFVTLLALFGIPYGMYKIRKSNVTKGKQADKLLEKIEEDQESQLKNYEIELPDYEIESQDLPSEAVIESEPPPHFVQKPDDPELEFLKGLGLDSLYTKNYLIEEEKEEKNSIEEPEDTRAEKIESESSPRLPSDIEEKGIPEEETPWMFEDTEEPSSYPTEPVSTQLAEEKISIPEPTQEVEEELEPVEKENLDISQSVVQEITAEGQNRIEDEKFDEEKPEVIPETLNEDENRVKAMEDLKLEMEKTIERISSQLSDSALEDFNIPIKVIDTDETEFQETEILEPEAPVPEEAVSEEPEVMETAEPPAWEEKIAEPDLQAEPVNSSVEPEAEETMVSETAQVDTSESPETRIEEPEFIRQPVPTTPNTDLLIERLQKFQKQLEERLHSIESTMEKRKASMEK